MIKSARVGIERLKTAIWTNRDRIYTYAVICGVALAIVLMYVRAFLGTELTDEAYYVSEAKEILNGNVPFAYNFSSKCIGFAFLLVVLIALYGCFVPSLAGVFLFIRLCFVTYKVLVWAVAYSVLKKKLRHSHALLISALIIPLNGPILNFSYNTIPELTFFMVGCLLYDVIEQDAPKKRLRLIVSGFLTGIACFANPGWSVALIIFSALIVIRVKGKKEKLASLLCYLGSVFAVVLLVFIPICLRTSFSECFYGFYRLFIHPLPSKPLNPNKSWRTVLASFFHTSVQWTVIFVLSFSIIYLLLLKYGKEPKNKETKRQYAIIAISCGFFLHSLYLIFRYNAYLSSSFGGEYRGYITFCYLMVFLIAGAFRNEKIVWYSGSYQVTYAIAAILLVSANASIYRFINTYTVIIPILYVLIKNRSVLVRGMAIILTVAVTGSLLYANYNRIYRDVPVSEMTCRVQSGVYKGLYTSPTRARDLPAMEQYLNSVIGEHESYSFRDNSPFAYLMTHKGQVCDLQTWDSLQYFCKKNSPEVLYDYYRVRDMIPDKIIYIQRSSEADQILSAQDSEWKYTKWVESYYDLVERVELNDTFPLILVYQYNGTFDGDYQRWIDNP